MHFAIIDKLAHLLGDYQSDSDNDDSDQRHKIINDVTTGERLKIIHKISTLFLCIYDVCVLKNY